MSFHKRLWYIETYKERDMLGYIKYEEHIKSILLEVRELEIHRIVTLTRESTTFFVVTYAQMLGILASPNSWLMLDVVSADSMNPLVFL